MRSGKRMLFRAQGSLSEKIVISIYFNQKFGLQLFLKHQIFHKIAKKQKKQNFCLKKQKKTEFQLHGRKNRKNRKNRRLDSLHVVRPINIFWIPKSTIHVFMLQQQLSQQKCIYGYLFFS